MEKTISATADRQAKARLWQAHCATVGRLLDLRHEIELFGATAVILEKVDALIEKTKAGRM